MYFELCPILYVDISIIHTVSRISGWEGRVQNGRLRGEGHGAGRVVRGSVPTRTEIVREPMALVTDYIDDEVRNERPTVHFGRFAVHARCHSLKEHKQAPHAQDQAIHSSPEHLSSSVQRLLFTAGSSIASFAAAAVVTLSKWGDYYCSASWGWADCSSTLGQQD